jgi:hypothetical protein
MQDGTYTSITSDVSCSATATATVTVTVAEEERNGVKKLHQHHFFGKKDIHNNNGNYY